MISRYRILARVDLLHDYYADGACPDFSVAPSKTTSALLADRRLRWKTVGNKLLVLAEVDAAGKPVPPLSPDLRMVFHMDLAGTAFLSVSGVDAAALASRRFHFSNLAGNAVGSPPGQVLNLSLPPAVFDPARTYLPGAFVRLGNTTYECTRAGTGQAPDAADSAFWVSKGAVRYASTADMVPILPSLTHLTLQTPASAFRVRISGLDPAAGTYTSLIREEVIRASALEASREVQVDLGGLPPGRYHLDINGESFQAWFEDEAVADGAFGIIELFNHMPAVDAYSMLDAQGAVKETAYSVRFSNRRAYWKYITPLHKVDSILVSGDHTLPSPFTAGSDDPGQPGQKDFFLSNRPLPLQEAPSANLFDLMMGSEARPAPKPDPRLPGAFIQTYDGGLSAYTDTVCTIRLNH